MEPGGSMTSSRSSRYFSPVNAPRAYGEPEERNVLPMLQDTA